MNVIQRSVLKQHFRQLANDIILTDTLLGAMYQNQIFERNMIDLIKAEKTEGDKVCKLLELLPKRGPDAFDLFLEIIQNDYPWLAAMLSASVKQETLNRAPTKPDLKQDNDSARFPSDLFSIDADMDIKTKVSTFIHKQFGNSKRISENDKKTMIRWMSQTVHNERHRKLTSSSSSAKLLESISMTTEDKCCGTDSYSEDSDEDTSDKIIKLHHKLQEFKKDHKLKSTPEHASRLDSSLSSDSQTEPQNSARQGQRQIKGCLDSMVMDVQYLMGRLEEMDNEVNKCYLMLGDRAKSLSLSLLIYDMSITTKQKEKELRMEKQKSEKMLNELYEYSKKVTHLEQAKALQEVSSVSYTEEVNKLQRQLEEKDQHIVKLEHLNKLHTEKQHTLENLRSMVKDLQNNNSMSRSTRAASDSIRSLTSRQAPRYGMARTKTDGETGPLQLGSKKNVSSRPYKRKNNPSIYKL